MYIYIHIDINKKEDVYICIDVKRYIIKDIRGCLHMYTCKKVHYIYIYTYTYTYRSINVPFLVKYIYI